MRPRYELRYTGPKGTVRSNLSPRSPTDDFYSVKDRFVTALQVKVQFASWGGWAQETADMQRIIDQAEDWHPASAPLGMAFFGYSIHQVAEFD